MDDLINPNPVIHARRATRRRLPGGGCGAADAAGSGSGACSGSGRREPIDALEVFEHLRDITDPEHPYTLEQLNVLEEGHIAVDDAGGAVRCGCTRSGLRARTMPPTAPDLAPPPTYTHA